MTGSATIISMKKLLSIAVSLICLVCALSGARGEAKAKKAKKVAFLPVKDFRQGSGDLFYDKPEQRDESGFLNKISGFVIERFSGEYEITVFSEESLRERLNSLIKQQEGAIIARGYLHLGIDQF